MCKPLYAPLMESTRTKQWWLLSSVSWLGATCLYASLATSLHSATPLLLTLVSLNLASAVQVCHHKHHYHPPASSLVSLFRTSVWTASPWRSWTLGSWARAT